MKVKFSIGGKHFEGDSSNISGVLKQFEDEIEKTIKVSIGDDVAGRAMRIAKALKRYGTTENRSIFRTISRLLTSVSSTSQDGEIYSEDLASGTNETFITSFGVGKNELKPIDIGSMNQGVLTWKPLHPSTVRRKREESRDKRTGVKMDAADKFFYRTGELRKFFRTNATSLGDALGPLGVTFHDERGRFVSSKNPKGNIATISITMMKNVNKGLLPGFRGGNWTQTDRNLGFEKSIGLGGDIITKLMGPKDGHRPLVQPVVNYYLLYRIPQLVNGIIAKELSTSRNRVTGSKDLL